MITNPKVGDKYWIIFVQHDGSCNTEYLTIARATVTFIEATCSDDGELGPYCLCAVIKEDSHIFFAPQKVRTYHMYNTWKEALSALDSCLLWGIFKLRQYREQIKEEARKKLQELPDGYKEEDLEGTVEEFFADQCSMIGIQEPYESPKEKQVDNTADCQKAETKA